MWINVDRRKAVTLHRRSATWMTRVANFLTCRVLLSTFRLALDRRSTSFSVKELEMEERA